MSDKHTILKRGLVQIHLEVDSQTCNLVRSNHCLDCSLEFTLGIELLEFLQVLSKILTHKHGIVIANPLVAQRLGCRHATGRTDGKKGCNQILGLFRHLSPVFLVEFVLTLTNLAEQVALVLLDKRRITTQKNVDNYSQRPHISFGIIRNAFKDLRSHISGSATLSCETVGLRTLLGETKVCNLDIRIVLLRLEKVLVG